MEKTTSADKSATNGKMKDSKRIYYAKVAIVGPTGTGKSYLSKTADKKTTGYINSENQPLPYKTEPFTHEGRPKTWAGFMKNLEDFKENPEVLRIIIDSQTKAFQTLNAEAQKNFVNWDIPKHYNKEVYKYLTLLKSIEKDVIIFSHDEVFRKANGDKERRMVVHNKEFEGKIEEDYVIVLYSNMRMEKEKPKWYLSTFEEGTSTKVPEGMFPDKDGNNLMEIPNDAAYIFSAVEKYYSL